MDIASYYIHQDLESALRIEAFNTRLERIRAGIIHFGGARLGVNELPIVY